jgi:hypothetical protein
MNNDAAGSEATGFERSHGFMPWDHFGNVVVALNNLGRAMLLTWHDYYSAVQQNSAQTERELIRWHASLLNTCLDVVNDRLDAVERRPGGGGARVAPETIVVE